MWAKAYRNFPHSNQDTNNAIESYHGYLKQRYLSEHNHACHRRVGWLIHVLLTKVELYYKHMQHLKEVGVIRPKKSQEQLKSSRFKANKIPNKDCVVDHKSIGEYRVRSQNKDTRGTWYNVIYKGSTFHFCDCNWALNGNVCKHVLKVGMLASNDIFGDNLLSNVSSSFVERPRSLVDLNETIVSSPKLQTNPPLCFDSPSNLSCHIETSINDVDNSSYHVDSTPVRLDNVVSEVDGMESMMESINQEFKGLLSIKPKNFEEARALKNVLANARKEYNKMLFSITTPSKVTTKRRHSVLSPTNKKRWHSHGIQSGKEKSEFQRVGRVRAKKKSMDEQLQLHSQKHRNEVDASDLVKHSSLHNIGKKI